MKYHSVRYQGAVPALIPTGSEVRNPGMDLASFTNFSSTVSAKGIILTKIGVLISKRCRYISYEYRKNLNNWIACRVVKNLPL